MCEANLKHMGKTRRVRLYALFRELYHRGQVFVKDAGVIISQREYVQTERLLRVFSSVESPAIFSVFNELHLQKAGDGD